MERCPSCRADVRGKTVCRRCKTDLSPLRDVEARAERHAAAAREAGLSGDFGRMRFHAQRSCSLRSTPGALRLLAAADLLTRRFDAALGLWAAYRRAHEDAGENGGRPPGPTTRH